MAKYEVVVTGILERYIAEAVAESLEKSNMPDSMHVEIREVEEEANDNNDNRAD